MDVVLLSSDLSVLARVEGAASGLGKKVRIAANLSQVLEYANAEPLDLVIVDLSLASLDIEATVKQFKAAETTTTRVIAFGPHVHENRLGAARNAGCDLVVSRGQFFAQLADLLS